MSSAQAPSYNPVDRIAVARDGTRFKLLAPDEVEQFLGVHAWVTSPDYVTMLHSDIYNGYTVFKSDGSRLAIDRNLKQLQTMPEHYVVLVMESVWIPKDWGPISP